MAQIVQLTIDQASSFERELTARDSNGQVIDLTDYSVVAAAKPAFVSFNAFPFTTEITSAENGRFKISMTDQQTASMAPMSYMYDVRIVHNVTAAAIRTHQGKIIVTPAVTDANPFVHSQGVRISDPSVVHKHRNLDLLENMGAGTVVAATNYEVLNGEHIYVDTTNQEIVVVVPDEPIPFFCFKAFDLESTWSINNFVIQNESGDEIHREDSLNSLFFVYVGGTYGWKGF